MSDGNDGDPFKQIARLITERDQYAADAKKYETELTAVEQIVQRVHPMGSMMSIGLLNVAEALREMLESYTGRAGDRTE